jgi:hypothetical protein
MEKARSLLCEHTLIRGLAGSLASELGSPRNMLEPVGKYHYRPNGRDIDYVLSKSAAADDLIALLADDVEPTVVVRRYAGGDTDLFTSFEM